MRFADNRNKIGKYIPAVVFLIFIYGMALWFLFSPKTDYSSSEKRYLQKFPDANVEKVLSGEFGSEFETFFADQFPQRNTWVGINAYTTLAEGNNGASGVYNCKNGYLINKPVSTDNNLDKNVGAVVDFAKTIDAPTTVMLVPSTGYIADDVLPTFHDKYNDDEDISKISSTLSKEKIGFVDLRERFKSEYKNGSQLYYKTDHHWTTKGAYTGYQELCKALGITPIDDSTLKKDSYPDFYGTTYSSSGFWLTPPDNIEIWSNPKNSDKNISVKITEGANVKTSGSMYFTDHLKEDDKYPVFIDGNHALTEITNTNAKNGTILLIKDSFSHSLAPFLAENYSKVVLVDLRYYKESASQLVSTYNPEQVVVLYGIDNLATDTDIVWLK
ncbi:DHHW family protein [Ruminococcus bromii]|uniref:DHHW family protein n=1 Tax=Ruminococcus bromii TaxID=40518 RepID=UPI0026F11EFD|nr:DHHW family protein [Ruminococcus bromii]